MSLIFLLVIMVLVPSNRYAFHGLFNCDGLGVPHNCHGLGHMVSILHGYHDLVFLLIIALLVLFLLCFFLSPYFGCSSWSVCSCFPSNHHGLGVLPSYCDLVFLLIVMVLCFFIYCHDFVFFLVIVVFYSSCLPWSCVCCLTSYYDHVVHLTFTPLYLCRSNHKLTKKFWWQLSPTSLTTIGVQVITNCALTCFSTSLGKTMVKTNTKNEWL